MTFILVFIIWFLFLVAKIVTCLCCFVVALEHVIAFIGFSRATDRKNYKAGYNMNSQNRTLQITLRNFTISRAQHATVFWAIAQSFEPYSCHWLAVQHQTLWTLSGL